MPLFRCLSALIPIVALCACSMPSDDAAPAAEVVNAEADRAVTAPAEQRAIESALIQRVTFVGEEGSRPSIEARMAELKAPALSLAVFRDGQLAWAQTYGEGIDVETRFQAASLTKAVAATGIVQLAQERGIGLDDDIADQLSGVDMSRLNPEGVPITLRGLLSHTNGATVSGFPGYPTGSALPTTAQVVEGAEPANTDPVVIEASSETTYRYSGGGYTVAQLWAESVSGESFAALMDRLVLKPTGMQHSFFSTGSLERFPTTNVASAADRQGQTLAGGWHRYPELAAAGLWTTPTDYARYMAALVAASKGDTTAGIAPSVAAEVLTPVANDYGLGMGVKTRDGEISLSHSGSNKGYKALAKALPARGDVLVAMTSADAGFLALSDIARTADAVYGWPAPELTVRSRFAATDEQLGQFAGLYAEDGDGARFALRAEGGELIGEASGGARFRLVPTGPAEFIDPDDGEEGRFEASGNGGMTIHSGDSVYVRQ